MDVSLSTSTIVILHPLNSIWDKDKIEKYKDETGDQLFVLKACKMFDAIGSVDNHLINA